MEYREGSDVVLDWHCMDGRIESLIASTGSLRQGLRTTLKDASLHSFCTEKQEGKEKERERPSREKESRVGRDLDSLTILEDG